MLFLEPINFVRTGLSFNRLDLLFCVHLLERERERERERTHNPHIFQVEA